MHMHVSPFTCQERRRHHMAHGAWCRRPRAEQSTANKPARRRSLPFLIQKSAAVRRGAGWHCRPRLQAQPITRLASPPSPPPAARRRHSPSRFRLPAALQPLRARHIFFVLPLLLPLPVAQEVEVEVVGTCRLQLPSPTPNPLRRYSSPPPG